MNYSKMFAVQVILLICLSFSLLMGCANNKGAEVKAKAEAQANVQGAGMQNDQDVSVDFKTSQTVGRDHVTETTKVKTVGERQYNDVKGDITNNGQEVDLTTITIVAIVVGSLLLTLVLYGAYRIIEMIHNSNPVTQ